MKKNRYFVLVAFLAVTIGSFVLGMNFSVFTEKIKSFQEDRKLSKEEAKMKLITKEVTPDGGFTLPISWGDLGPRLVSKGVIDQDKFKWNLAKTVNEPVEINSQNSQFVVNFLWAIGLAQKSIVYDQGPMGKEYKDSQDNFASTGGWTLAKGDATQYLNKFDLIPLTPQQQEKVAEIAKNVYRPCCDNPTWFPDCNHGMAALGAIEMMVFKNIPDDEIYQNLLKLNSFWFPDTYLTMAYYFDNQGVQWGKVDAKKALSKDFSSASGAQRLQSIVGPLPNQENSGSCGA